MKGKFGIVALLFSSIAVAAPVSTPGPLNDTPIISGGGTVSGGGICRAYQTNGEAVPLSGGETLVFYGSGGERVRNTIPPTPPSPLSTGGYLSTKSNYSGTAYVRVKMGNLYYNWLGQAWSGPGGAIGLFAQNTDSKNDFIAGAGAGGTGVYAWTVPGAGLSYTCHPNASSGGGWVAGGVCAGESWFGWDSPPADRAAFLVYGGSVYGYDSMWFTNWYPYSPCLGGCTPGFHSSGPVAGGASSISAFYNSYTRDYTSFATSLTITGGGLYGRANPTLYVCK
jgi:hypothetical protein